MTTCAPPEPGNGTLPASALVSIGHGGHRLAPAAAASFKRMERRAAQDGVHFDVTDSYRSLPEQYDCVRRKGLKSQGGLCACPGHSDHGRGVAIDTGPAVARQWLRDHGGEFGWIADVSGEPWHWHYTGSAAPTGGTGVNGALTASPTASGGGSWMGQLGTIVAAFLNPDTYRRIGLVLGGAVLAYLGYRMTTGDVFRLPTIHGGTK